MRTIRLVGLFVAVALATSSCGWLQLGGDAARTSFNADETKLTSDKLGSLDYPWYLRSEGHVNAPIINDGVLYTTADNVVTARDANTGHAIWQKTITNPAGTVVLLEPTWYKTELVVLYNVVNASLAIVSNGLLEFDAKTGLIGDHSLGTTIEPHGMVVRGTEEAQSFITRSATPAVVVNYAPDAPQACLDPCTGNFIGLMSLDPTEIPTRPMLLGRRLFVGAGSKIFAFSLDTCPASTLKPTPGICGWEWMHDYATIGSKPTVTMPVGVGADAIVFGSSGGPLRVLDAATGATRWSSGFQTDDRGFAVAPGQGGIIYSASSGHLRAWYMFGCGAATCSPEWSRDVVGAATAPIVAADVVYLGGSDGKVHAFRHDDTCDVGCGEIWSASVGGTKIWPIVWSGRIYVTSDAGTVAALKMYP
jgi:outer membrane protein assembly factor BamB